MPRRPMWALRRLQLAAKKPIKESARALGHRLAQATARTLARVSRMAVFSVKHSRVEAQRRHPPLRVDRELGLASAARVGKVDGWSRTSGALSSTYAPQEQLGVKDSVKMVMLLSATSSQRCALAGRRAREVDGLRREARSRSSSLGTVRRRVRGLALLQRPFRDLHRGGGAATRALRDQPSGLHRACRQG